jgi:ABC-2 type transport system permease protein
LAADTNPELLRRLGDPVTIEPYNLQRASNAAQDEDADFVMIYVFTIVFLMALFLTNSYLLQTVVEEKENKLIEILVSSVTPGQLLAGKILAMSVLGIGQIVVWIAALLLALRIVVNLEAFATATVLLNIRIQMDILPLMLVYFILGYLLFAAIYAGVGALAGSLRESSQYVALFSIMAVLPFYVFTVFVQTPNGTLPVVMSLIPITAPVAMMMRLNVTTVPPLEIAASLLILVACVALMMWIAGRLFRVQTLLSGNFPKLRDIPKLIRG